MKRMLADWGIALAVAITLIAGAAWWDRLSRPSGAAPALTLVDTAGVNHSLTDFRGKTVVVNFWGTWCPPCRAEIPQFAAWSQAHPDVVVLGVAARSGRGAVLASAAAKLGVTYTVLVADDPTLAAWAIDVYPSTFVIKPDGEIGAYTRGAIDGSDLDRLVAEAGG